jgi:hypothetical protein
MEQDSQELPKKLTPALKRKITKDWHACLPGLTLRKPMSLKRRVGPLLIGVGLQPKVGSTYYEPEFSVHNLSRPLDFLTAMLDEPLRSSRTNGSESLRVCLHNRSYREAAQRMNNQALLPLEGPVSLEQVINAYQSYVAKPRIWPVLGLLEDPALISAWAGEERRAQEALEWGYQMLKTWDLALDKGESYYKEGNADLWRIKMENLIADPEALRQTARDEAIRHKLTMIPYQDFTDTVYKEADNNSLFSENDEMQK